MENLEATKDLSSKVNSIFEQKQSTNRYDLELTATITTEQAAEYISNDTNPEQYRLKLSDLLSKYEAIADPKVKSRVLIVVSRFGHCCLWMDQTVFVQ